MPERRWNNPNPRLAAVFIDRGEVIYAITDCVRWGPGEPS